MGKNPTKEVMDMQAKLDATHVALKRLEAENGKLQRRLHAKALEVSEARQARREALTLLREAASHDAAISEKAIALLAADAMSEAQVAALAAQAASQTVIPGTESAVS